LLLTDYSPQITSDGAGWGRMGGGDIEYRKRELDIKYKDRGIDLGLSAVGG